MVIPRPRPHSKPVLMCASEMMKPGFGKASRSVLHRFITAALPFAPTPDTRFEILGGVMVVGLSTGMLVLMRFLLAN